MPKPRYSSVFDGYFLVSLSSNFFRSEACEPEARLGMHAAGAVRAGAFYDGGFPEVGLPPAIIHF